MPKGDITFDFTMDELGRALDRVSEDIKREIGALIPVAAEQMVGVLERTYPYGRRHPNPQVPHMRDDIRTYTVVGNDPLIQGRRVVGPHLAYIWQDGTDERWYFTQKNVVRHRTGRGPIHDKGFFERTAVQIRQAMLNQARDILDRPREL